MGWITMDGYPPSLSNIRYFHSSYKAELVHTKKGIILVFQEKQKFAHFDIALIRIGGLSLHFIPQLFPPDLERKCLGKRNQEWSRKSAEEHQQYEVKITQ